MSSETDITIQIDAATPSGSNGWALVLHDDSILKFAAAIHHPQVGKTLTSSPDQIEFRKRAGLDESIVPLIFQCGDNARYFGGFLDLAEGVAVLRRHPYLSALDAGQTGLRMATAQVEARLDGAEIFRPIVFPENLPQALNSSSHRSK